MDNIGKIYISRLRFLSSKEKMSISSAFRNSEELFNLTKTDIEAIIGRRLRKNVQTLKIARSETLKAKKILADNPIKCLFLGDENYPSALAEIFNPPFALFYRGSLPELSNSAIAVVGTRVATGAALDAAFELGFDFAEKGFPVVSGLALGVDSAGHSGAVAAGGQTIAVLGCGVDSIYPATNKDLAATIIKMGGTILSEYLPGESARRYNFVERNRIISGLTRGVVVVQAPGKSGALITADFAIDQGRDLYIHKVAIPDCKNASHLERLVSEGAPVITGINDVLADWGLPIKEKVNIDNLNGADSFNAGLLLASRMKSEIEGNCIKFNGNFFRRGCNESPYSFNSRVTG